MSLPHSSSHDLNPRSKESLLNAINTEEGRQRVVSLRGDDAEHALTLLQKELDGSLKHRVIVSRVIRILIRDSGRVPSDLWLTHIQEGKEVARGAYGAVHKGSWKGEAVALKFLHPSVKNGFENFVREVTIWRQFSHENILPFWGLYQNEFGKKAMVSPWQSGGNIVDFIRKHPGEDRHRLLIQVASGLTYLHELDPPIVHADLKPENILITNEHRAVLADFGLSHMQHDLTELVSSDHVGVKGTIPYLAPELFEDTPIQSKTSTSRDIWALGMVVYRLFTGEVPFADRQYPKGTCDAIASGARPKPRKYHDKQLGFTDELWDFLDNNCWKMSQEERPSARYCKGILKVLRSRWVIEKAAKLASPYQDLVEEIINVPQNYRRTLFNSRVSYLQSLSEQFGVRIAEGTYEKIKIWGDKTNVEAAMKDIVGDCKNWSAVQKTTYTSVPSRLKGTIIGKGGESVKALEKEYSVKITISDVAERVSITGPPDNVERAKAGLQSRVEYIQLHNDICELHLNRKLITRLQFPQFLRESREELGLRELYLTDTSVIMRGPKEALEKAQKHFYYMQEKFDGEITLTLTEDIDILSQLVNGVAWSNIVGECNGPSNYTHQRALVTLRQEENEVVLTGEEALVGRLRDQLYREVIRRREVVLGMGIPHRIHRDLLREYGIDEIQRTARVLICFPGGEKYDNLPEHQNSLADDLFEIDERDIVKIRGTPEACANARQMLKERVEKARRLRCNVTFGAKYHEEVRGLVLSQLKRMGIQVLPSSRPPPTTNPPISLAPLPKTPWISWGLKCRFDRTDKDVCAFDLRAEEKELDEAVEILKQAVRKVSAASYIGCLKFSKETKFGYLFGPHGETIRRLRTETNTKIEVADANAKDDPCTVKIIGSKKHVEQARDKIIRLLDPRWITMENVNSK